MSARSTIPSGARLDIGGSDVVGHGAAGLAQALDHLARLGRPLRVWCAGAGGVGEPMTVLLLAAAAGLDVEVIATDVAPATAAAMHATTVSARMLRLPSSVTGSHLAVDARGHRLTPALSARLRVATGDLREIPAGGPFDLVVCRDVLHHYRGGAADVMLRGLLQATGRDGVVVITAVDALAAGRPISGSRDLLLRQHGDVASLEAFLDDEDAHPNLRLAALSDPDVDVAGRIGRLLRLAEHAPAREEARLVAGALALAGGQRELGRQLLELPVSVGLEGDASTLLAIDALGDGQQHNARALLARAQPDSWLAAYLMGRLAGRQQRTAEANASFRSAISLLDGHGVAPAGSAFLEGCGPEAAWAACREALRVRPTMWHGT